MNLLREILDQAGVLWKVESKESSNLININGFLVTYDDEGCITVSSMLSTEDKARGCEILLQRLVKGKIKRRSVTLWRSDDNE